MQLSLVGEWLRALGDRQGPPVGVLFLVVSGPFGLSSFLFCFEVSIGDGNFVGNLAHRTSDLFRFTEP